MSMWRWASHRRNTQLLGRSSQFWVLLVVFFEIGHLRCGLQLHLGSTQKKKMSRSMSSVQWRVKGFDLGEYSNALQISCLHWLTFMRHL